MRSIFNVHGMHGNGVTTCILDLPVDFLHVDDVVVAKVAPVDLPQPRDLRHMFFVKRAGEDGLVGGVGDVQMDHEHAGCLGEANEADTLIVSWVGHLHPLLLDQLTLQDVKVVKLLLPLILLLLKALLAGAFALFLLLLGLLLFSSFLLLTSGER